jgi:hypothetical protein
VISGFLNRLVLESHFRIALRPLAALWFIRKEMANHAEQARDFGNTWSSVSNSLGFES